MSFAKEFAKELGAWGKTIEDKIFDTGYTTRHSHHESKPDIEYDDDYVYRWDDSEECYKIKHK